MPCVAAATVSENGMPHTSQASRNALVAPAIADFHGANAPAPPAQRRAGAAAATRPAPTAARCRRRGCSSDGRVRPLAGIIGAYGCVRCVKCVCGRVPKCLVLAQCGHRIHPGGTARGNIGRRHGHCRYHRHQSGELHEVGAHQAEQQRLHQPTDADCQGRTAGDADRGNHQRAAGDDAQHLPAARTERHADANLLGALRGQKRHQAVDADDREHQGQQANDAESTRNEHESRGTLLDHGVEGRQRSNGLIGIDLRDCATEITSQGHRIADGAQRERHRIRRRLADRPVDRVILPNEPVVHDVPGDADHGDPRSVYSQLESLAERIAVAPILAGERGADDRNLLAIDAIRIVEPAAAQQRNLQRRKVLVGRTPIPRKARLLLLEFHALGEEAPAVVVECRWNDAGGADLRHRRNRAHRFGHLRDETPPRVRVAVITFGQVELRDQHVGLVEAEHAVDGLLSRGDGQGGAKHQGERQRDLCGRERAAQPLAVPAGRQRAAGLPKGIGHLGLDCLHRRQDRKHDHRQRPKHHRDHEQIGIETDEPPARNEAQHRYRN